MAGNKNCRAVDVLLNDTLLLILQLHVDDDFIFVISAMIFPGEHVKSLLNEREE